MLGIQLLAQNLLYDISQIAIPWDRVDPEYLKTPKSWKTWGVFEGTPVPSCPSMRLVLTR